MICFFILAGSDLICRSCGHKITSGLSIINIQSDSALDSHNRSIVGIKTLVQTFGNRACNYFFLYFN